MNNSLQDYFDALERLKRQKAKISNDSVAVEAGRKKGSIKKSRPQFLPLIAAIDAARRPVDRERTRLQRSTAECKELQRRLDEALSRELSLLEVVCDLKRELTQIRGGNVTPIR